MILPVQITFRNMPPSEAVATRIRKETAKLDRYYGRITSCRVVVEAPHRHHRRGEQFHIRIELGVPGGEVAVRHGASLLAMMQRSEASEWHRHFEAEPDHKDIYVAIRDSFKAARRRLQDHVRRMRGDVKSHEFPITAPSRDR